MPAYYYFQIRRKPAKGGRIGGVYVVQAGVGKRFFRRKYNPEQTLAIFARISRNV